MPTKPKSSVNYDRHLSTVSRMPTLSGEVLLDGDLDKEQQQHITNQTGIDLEIQRGVALKQQYAEYLTQRIDDSTMQRYDEFLKSQRALLSKDGHHPQDQADLEHFLTILKQLHGEALLALRNACLDTIDSLAARPASRPPDKRRTEEVVVRPAQGLWRRVRGELEYTTIKR